MPGKTAKEIADWIEGPHTQKNGEAKEGLMAAVNRLQWLNKTDEPEPAQPLNQTPAAGVDQGADDGDGRQTSWS